MYKTSFFKKRNYKYVFIFQKLNNKHIIYTVQKSDNNM